MRGGKFREVGRQEKEKARHGRQEVCVCAEEGQMQAGESRLPLFPLHAHCPLIYKVRQQGMSSFR